MMKDGVSGGVYWDDGVVKRKGKEDEGREGKQVRRGRVSPYDIRPRSRGRCTAEVDKTSAFLLNKVRHYHFAAVEEGFHIDSD